MPVTADRRRYRRALRVLAAAVLAAGVIAAGGVLAACGSTDASRDASARAAAAVEREELSRNGLTITVRDGWHGESFVNDRGTTVFRVGSFVYPERPDDDGGQIARDAMGADDVLINIVDLTGVDTREDVYRPVSAPLTVVGSKATGQEGYPVPAVVDSVLLGGHKLYLSVAFGRDPPSATQVAAANEVLATVTGS